ncbi:MAG: heme exporter protein B [Candidatus Tokpelaia sp. JSC161]|jgi:heme exporter protein B|nr:MAG: heme exporter protein B [Candidatus Tokpelaia sp. JSC161]
MRRFFIHELKFSLLCGKLGVSILFFVSVILLVLLAIGPDMALISRISAGIVWIAVLFSMFLGLDRLFQRDKEDGSLDMIVMDTDVITLGLFVFLKCLAHWIANVLPLIFMFPFFLLC